MDEVVTKSPYNNPRWLRLRKLVLNAHPLCKHCLAEGEQKLATEVDHIKRAVYDGKKVDQNDSGQLAIFNRFVNHIISQNAV